MSRVRMRARSGKVRKRKPSKSKQRELNTAVKMLAVMEPNPESSNDPVTEFLVTGRTGRRNAMADILGPHASTSSGDLPEKLQSLCTADSEAGATSSSSSSSTQDQMEAKVKTCNNTSITTSTTDQSKPEGNS